MLNRGDSLAFADVKGCAFSPNAATPCVFALRNGSGQDVIVDTDKITLLFSYGEKTITLMRTTTEFEALKKSLQSEALKKSYLLVEKGKTVIVDLSPSGSDWQSWVQEAGGASVSTRLSVSYAVLGEQTLDWKPIYWRQGKN